MERVDHFLLLRVIVAIVEVLRCVLRIQFRICLHTFVRLLRVYVRLHVGKVWLVSVRTSRLTDHATG